MCSKDSVPSIEDIDGLSSMIGYPVIIDMRDMLRIKIREIRNFICVQE